MSTLPIEISKNGKKSKALKFLAQEIFVETFSNDISVINFITLVHDLLEHSGEKTKVNTFCGECSDSECSFENSDKTAGPCSQKCICYLKRTLMEIENKIEVTTDLKFWSYLRSLLDRLKDNKFDLR